LLMMDEWWTVGVVTVMWEWDGDVCVVQAGEEYLNDRLWLQARQENS
jgi:hypothetical protein